MYYIFLGFWDKTAKNLNKVSEQQRKKYMCRILHVFGIDLFVNPFYILEYTMLTFKYQSIVLKV